jgi:hypothetical protein
MNVAFAFAFACFPPSNKAIMTTLNPLKNSLTVKETNRPTRLLGSSALTSLIGAIGLCMATPAFSGTLIALNFDESMPTGLATSFSAQPKVARVSQSISAEGTVDTYMGEPSKSLVLRADLTKVKAGQTASASVRTGRLSVRNTVSDLASLTLNFDLKVNQLRPVRAQTSSIRR